MKRISSARVTCFVVCSAPMRERVRSRGAGGRAASQLSDDHRMRRHKIELQQGCQRIVVLSKMCNPYRCIDEYFHDEDGSLLRRGMSCISGDVPPSAARRLPACTLMNVLIASLKRSDSSMEESAIASAFSYKSSSIVTVVLMAAFHIRFDAIVHRLENQDKHLQVSRLNH